MPSWDGFTRPASFRSQGPTGPCRSLRRTCRGKRSASDGLLGESGCRCLSLLCQRVRALTNGRMKAAGDMSFQSPSGQPPGHLWGDEKMGMLLRSPARVRCLGAQHVPASPGRGDTWKRIFQWKGRARRRLSCLAWGGSCTSENCKFGFSLLREGQLQMPTSSAGCSPDFSPIGDFQARPKSSAASLKVSDL